MSSVHGVAQGWGISQGFADRHWIGRLVLDWHISQSLPIDWGLSKDCIASEEGKGLVWGWN